MKRWIPLLLLFLFLTGCGKKPEAAPAPESETAATGVFHTVSFYDHEQLLDTRQIPQGSYAQAPAVNVPGYRIEGWYTAEGTPADLSQPIEKDTAFYARMYPILHPHRVYLFPDETGCYHPDSPLDGQALTDALCALAEDASLIDITLTEEITALQLKEVLLQFYSQEELEAVLPQGTVSRRDFTRCMNSLLKQTAASRICFTQPLAPSQDLPLEDGNFLLAVLPHKRDLLGEQDICTALWNSPWVPGYYLIGGHLYYADETGLPVSDTEIGYLQFGTDHRYTTGDSELDEILTDYFLTAMEETPGITREDILYKAFCHCRDNLEYLRDEYFDPGTHGWETEAGKKILVRGRGNCYNFAAAFCVFARALGYQAQAYSGHVGDRVLPHGWVVIETEEGRFLCDPEMAQLQEQGRRDNWGEDMFWIAQGDWSPWKYVFAPSDLENWEE